MSHRNHYNIANVTLINAVQMKNIEQIQITGDNHFLTSIKTPLRADAFK